MTRISLILTLTLLSSILVFAQGSSIATATAILPNGSAGGSMSDVSKDHYWKVTTTTDGYLRIQINSGSSIDVDVNLYDTDGTTSMTSDGQSGTYSEVFGFLKPGTYYVLAHRWTGTTGSYTITTSFVSPSRAADPESNDLPASATTLSPTGISTGHLGFFGTGNTDTDDYWKIAITQDGWLRVQVRSDSLDARADQKYDLDVTLYDINGTTNLFDDGRSGTFSQVDAFMRPGTYFVRVHRWSGRGGCYEIKSEFFTPPLADDPGVNDSYQTASTVTVNGSVTGHLGYFTNGLTDTDDYWKFTTTTDGKITTRIVSDSLDRSGVGFDLDLTIYDVNGTTSLSSDSRSGPLSECILFLRPGTYFARAHRWTGNGASYTLSVIQSTPARSNDPEGNDWFKAASTLTFNIASTGHLGYFSNGTTDSQDIWRLVAPSTDSIYVHVTSDSTLDLDVTAYAADTLLSVNYDSRAGIYSRVGIKPITGTAYYFKVYRWQGTGGSYSIVATKSSVAVGVERQQGEASIPNDLTLGQNYPNPFNPSTSIRYGLPQASTVRLSVYSILGQEIAVLVNGTQSPAFYTVRWDGKDHQGANVPSGMYLIRLQVGEKQIVNKAVLIR